MKSKLETVPHPWSRAAIEQAVFENFSAARESIEATPGWRLWRALHDLEDTLWIFEDSVTDLLDEICLFADRSKNPSFWNQANEREAEKHTRAVKKKLFHCTSALMALVDHARNFHRATAVVGFSERMREDFTPAGLHTFLQCLRNYNTHWRIAEANWVIQSSSQPSSREARFRVTKLELLRWDGWTVRALEFIESASDAIDIYDVFFAYRKQVQSFYTWHKGAVLDLHAPILQPYLEYKRVYEGIQLACTWNLLVTHAPTTLNPFQHLSRYLTKQQVERLLAYDHRSEAQVDALIRMVGMEEFCDERLRRKVLTLFIRPGMNE